MFSYLPLLSSREEENQIVHTYFAVDISNVISLVSNCSVDVTLET